jgi:hypothetical protein
MPIFSLKMQNISAPFRVGEGLGRGLSNSRWVKTLFVSRFYNPRPSGRCLIRPRPTSLSEGTSAVLVKFVIS